MALVQFDLNPGQADLPQGLRVPRHSPLVTPPVDGLACRFRTGYPVTGTAAATVIHADAELAEAATKALMVGGPGELAAICAAMDVEFALVVTTDGDLQGTPGILERLQQAGDPGPGAPSRPGL